jgi:nitrate/nitrite-specific signal transduction histidine kinase
LERWAQQPDQAAMPEVIHQVTRAVDRVVTVVNEEFRPANVDPATALGAIVDVWSGLADFNLTITPSASARLAVDQAATETVIEVVRECVGNAMRHGRARTISISIADPDGDFDQRGPAVEVTVCDDGLGVSPTAAAGLGSQLLNDACLSWRRQSLDSGRGTQVTARIPVEPATVLSADTGAHERTA